MADVTGEEGRFWLGEARNGTVAGRLGFVCEPGTDGVNRFYLVTLATCLRRQARHFAVIRPFHRLGVHAMIRHALAGAGHQNRGSAALRIQPPSPARWPAARAGLSMCICSAAASSNTWSR